MYVVTFAEPLPDGTFDVRHLRRMPLQEAQDLARRRSWPRRGVVVNADTGERVS